MDAFEFLVAALLRKDGYWTDLGYKVELSKQEKIRIGRPSSPRWEIDLLAYKAKTNEVIAVECKSFIDSPGVRYAGLCGENKKDAERYKLFNDTVLRRTVLQCLARQLVKSGSCRMEPRVTLGLATGKIVSNSDRMRLRSLFHKKKWILLDDEWIYEKLLQVADYGYEDSVASLAAKILVRGSKRIELAV